MTFLESTNPVTTVSGDSPITATEGATPVISIDDSTTDQKGAVQLEDSYTSTSIIKAATPKSVKDVYDYATTLSGHTHDDRYYTESEVDTISGSLSTEINDDIATHTSNSDAHHSESHTVVSHSDTTATGANLNELVGSGDTSLHKHDTMYYTESEIDTLSGTLQTDIDTKLENVIEDLAPELGGDLSCNNYNIENVGKMCARNLASTIYNGTGSTLTKGTAVTICGLQGEICTVCVTDNREIGKMPCCGVIEADVAAGAEGCGIRIGRLNMDTSGMTGNVEDRLYVQADGSLDTVIPTSGMVQRVGLLVVKASGNAGRICICIRGPRSMYSAKDQHPIVRMGDDAGHQKTVFKDYTDNEVAAFDSSGNLTLSGTVDGVDVATLKSDYDSHNHDDRYYTETELNNGQLDNRYYTESEVDTISGSLNTKISTKLANVSEDVTPDLGGQLGVGEYDIKYDALLSADGKYSGSTRDGVLGDTLSFGDLVYLNSSDQRWEKTDADAEATSGDVDLAIVLAAGSDGDTRLLLTDGYVREDTWNFTSYGKALYIATTSGTMTQATVSGSGDIVRVVGKAGTTANEIHFRPSQSWIELS